jgi:carbon-monoxide dehydrogenase small subunit
MKIYEGHVAIELRVNGEIHRAVVRPADTLLRVLREKLGLTGPKPGCENGDCGACTVLVDGKPTKSCLVLAVEVEGSEITTVEGLKDTAIQRAFMEHEGFQCGYCTPGFIVNAYALLKAHPQPTDDQMREWLTANICRCTGYEGIRNAVQAAAGEEV